MNHPLQCTMILAALFFQVLPKVQQSMRYYDTINCQDVSPLVIKEINKYFITTICINCVLPMVRKKMDSLKAQAGFQTY